MRAWTRPGAVIGMALGLALAIAAPQAASAGGGNARGDCTKSSSWRLKADSYDGRIMVAGEVDSSHGGQRWKWRILHDGYVSFHGRARSEGGGSFKVERQVIDTPGYDSIGWRAHNLRTGERCRGHVTI